MKEGRRGEGEGVFKDGRGEGRRSRVDRGERRKRRKRRYYRMKERGGGKKGLFKRQGGGMRGLLFEG